MTKRSILFFLSALTLFSTYAQSKASDTIQLTWDFENGSLGGWVQNASGEIVMTHSPASGGIWYYFRVDGLEGQTQTFVFEHCRKDYYPGHALPSVSYDDENWSYIKNIEITPDREDKSKVRYSFTHTFASNRVWFAYAPPYPNKRLDGLIKEIKPHPHVTIQTICRTPIHDIPIPIISITHPEMPVNDKQFVLFFAREEAIESASSWMAEGLIRFLLSDDPVAAALKRRCVFLMIPIFDRDGVALGTATHPLQKTEAQVYWTETWPETGFSFFEQRQLKRFLQNWKDRGNTIHCAFRMHSSAWNDDQIRQEYAPEKLFEKQNTLFYELITQKYMPWYTPLDRVIQNTRFSKFLFDLFPTAITGLCQSEFRYHQAFNFSFDLYKTQDDLQTDGQLIAYAFAEWLGIPASDPPPYLHAAELYNLVGKKNQPFHARCVYRDLLNRPPQFVRIMVGEEAFDLHPSKISEEKFDYRQGVLYTGFISTQEPINTHYFITSNGSRTFRLPYTKSREGPLLKIPPVLRKK